MNCATHSDTAAVAYCRTCGKPLCANCTRSVHGVIYCESCLAARLEGVQPPAAYVSPSEARPVAPPPMNSGPNPAVAGILGAIPFGVGAIYCGQYAKGLAHMIIFVLLIWGADSSHSDALSTLFGLGIAFFIFYQIFDAVRSAKAIQMGQPAPDPFGLGQAFGAGEKIDTSKIPTGAVVLIGLGLLFLFNTTGLFDVGFERLWPIFLIALGVWLFARRCGVAGGYRGCSCARCRARGLMGPAVLITIGALSLFEEFAHVGWDRSWPVLLIVIGLVKVFQSNASTNGHIVYPPQGPPAGPGTPESGNFPQPPQPPSSEVNHV